MEAHAHVVAGSRGDVLNVGFGLGLVDEAIQRRRPRTHTIIEASCAHRNTTPCENIDAGSECQLEVKMLSETGM